MDSDIIRLLFNLVINSLMLICLNTTSCYFYKLILHFQTRAQNIRRKDTELSYSRLSLVNCFHSALLLSWKENCVIFYSMDTKQIPIFPGWWNGFFLHSVFHIQVIKMNYYFFNRKVHRRMIQEDKENQ